MRRLWNWLFPVGEKLVAKKKVIVPAQVIYDEDGRNTGFMQDELASWSYVKRPANYRAFRFWGRLRIKL